MQRERMIVRLVLRGRIPTWSRVHTVRVNTKLNTCLPRGTRVSVHRFLLVVVVPIRNSSTDELDSRILDVLVVT